MGSLLRRIAASGKEIMVVALLVVAVLVIFQVSANPRADQGATSDTAATGYPNIAATVMPVVTALASAVTTPSDVEPAPYPTVSPEPTYKFADTPTPQQGPTATALPRVTPADSAAGRLLYFTEAESLLTALSIPVDAQGEVAGEASVLATAVPAGQIYPAPDGRRVALIPSPVAEAPQYVVILYLDDGHLEALFRKGLNPLGLFFGWHPDSQQVLLRAESAYTDIGLWLVNVDSETHVMLVGQWPYIPSGFKGDVYAAAVSPEGQRTIYTNQHDVFSPGELWLVNGNALELVYTGTPPVELAWSPDGSQIAFVGSDDLMLLDLQTSTTRSVSTTLNANAAQPAWSPDGRQIAFNAWGPAIPDPNSSDGATLLGNPEIHVVEVASGREYPLVADGRGTHHPTWSPDGRQLAFISDRSGVSEIWAANVDGSHLRQLTHTGQPVTSVTWFRP